jgi:hypothetical protein
VEFRNEIWNLNRSVICVWLCRRVADLFSIATSRHPLSSSWRPPRIRLLRTTPTAKARTARHRLVYCSLYPQSTCSQSPHLALLLHLKYFCKQFPLFDIHSKYHDGFCGLVYATGRMGIGFMALIPFLKIN